MKKDFSLATVEDFSQSLEYDFFSPELRGGFEPLYSGALSNKTYDLAARETKRYILSKYNDLRSCDRANVRSVARQALLSGLTPGGFSQEYDIIIRNNKGKATASFEIRANGWHSLAIRSGCFKTIVTKCIYAHDELDFNLGTNSYLRHKPNLFKDQKDEDIIGAYCIMKAADGSEVIELMSRGEIDKIKKSVKPTDFSPWVKFYPQQCRKTVLKAAIKRNLGHVLTPAQSIAIRVSEIHEMAQNGVHGADMNAEMAFTDDGTPFIEGDFENTEQPVEIQQARAGGFSERVAESVKQRAEKQAETAPRGWEEEETPAPEGLDEELANE